MRLRNHSAGISTVLWRVCPRCFLDGNVVAPRGEDTKHGGGGPVWDPTILLALKTRPVLLVAPEWGLVGQAVSGAQGAAGAGSAPYVRMSIFIGAAHPRAAGARSPSSMQ